MGKFTDVFINRPVLATVVSLMLLVIGLRALFAMQVLQFPRTENAVVTVSTTYFGADPELVAGFITQPLENAVAQANGIDYITSVSRSGLSQITANLRLNYDPNAALAEINTKVNAALNQLPPQAQQPSLTMSIGESFSAMYIAFASDVLKANEITDYLVRVVQPKLQAVSGVQTIEINGAQNFALRAWLDPEKLAAYNLTADDVRQSMASNNFLSGLGNTKGQMVEVGLVASTNVRSLEEFRKLVVKESGDAIVRLEDVANVSLGSETYDSGFSYNGRQGVAIGVRVAPGANLLDVVAGIITIFNSEVKPQLPQGLTAEVAYNSANYVRSSINEVISTIIEALLIVTLVVFAFLGSPRSVVIPVVAIPLSLLGSFAVMLMFGFSINLLTLLALVLSIGLVVDDAIIVVENVNRHLEEGMKPIPASIRAARELGGPIIAMAVVLIAVYVPIGFQGGLTGALFTEFAFTLVAAVVVSTIVALTLSPMMCSLYLKPRETENVGWVVKLEDRINGILDKVRHRYERMLHSSLNTLPVTLTFALIILCSIFFLFQGANKELAPQEDQGFIGSMATSSPTATFDQRQMYAEQVYKIFRTFPETVSVFQFDAPGQAFAGISLQPWDQRERGSGEVQADMQNALNSVAGVNAAAFQFPSLPGAFGMPIQLVLGTTQSFSVLNEVSQSFMQEAMASGMFMFLDIDLKVDRPQVRVDIDRDKAAQLGLSMAQVGSAMSSMLGGGYVNYFALDGRSYRVIPQVQQQFRLNPEQVLDYHVRTADGFSVPLSTIASISHEVVPQSLARFQQLNAATISGVMAFGVTQGAALEYLQQLAARTLPQGFNVDYAGPSRQFVQEGAGFVLTFAFAVVIIFLALAALFESFRDPLIILVSVPMSIAGAMIFINLGIGGASINIYTQVGLVTLMGLISKHGILIVEFANGLQAEGKSKREAIEQAAVIRLRPILMTTAAMVLGVIPLIMASGAGAASRFNLGLVIAAGLSVGTLFTLFVLPAVYLLLAADHHKKAEAEDDGAAASSHA